MIILTDGEHVQALDTEPLDPYIRVRQQAWEMFVWDIARHPKAGRTRLRLWLRQRLGVDGTEMERAMIFTTVAQEAMLQWYELRRSGGEERRWSRNRGDFTTKEWRQAEARWRDELMAERLRRRDINSYGRVLEEGENPFGEEGLP